MAKTSIASGATLARKAYIEKIFRDNIKLSYFGKFMGKEGDDNAPIFVKSDLTKDRGEQLVFGMRMRVTGEGRVGGQILEGHEESLTTHSYTLTLEQYRHAVRDNGALTRQRPAFNMSVQAENAIRDWGAEKIDDLCFDAITASPTYTWYLSSGTAYWTATESVATGAVTSDDLLTPTLISRVRAWARTGGNRTNAITPLRTINVDGGKYYVLIVHPDVGYDIKTNSIWAQAQREAALRGNQNPLFSGAIGIWDNVVIHEHENIPLATTWGTGSDVAGAKCVFMGAQALCFAWGRRPKLIPKKFDYDNEEGYAWDMICRAGKPKFNTSYDYGSIAVDVARTQTSDASAQT